MALYSGLDDAKGMVGLQVEVAVHALQDVGGSVAHVAGGGGGGGAAAFARSHEEGHTTPNPKP